MSSGRSANLRSSGGQSSHHDGDHKALAPRPLSGPRLRWTPELHRQFLSAINQLGGADKATPKTILNIMRVEGVTPFQIKSHLQKHRLGKTSRWDAVPADIRNHNILVEGSVNNVEKMPNPAPLTAAEKPSLDDLHYFPEWSDILKCDYLHLFDYSSRSGVMFGSLFDEVERFPLIEDDLMMDDIVSLDAQALGSINNVEDDLMMDDIVSMDASRFY